MKQIDPLWTHGIGDRVMDVLKWWVLHYHTGKVSATGRYLTKPGERGPSPQEINVPTRYACEVAWLQGDLDYLIKILEAKVPTWPTTKDLRTNFPRWKNGRITKGGARIVTMDYYFQDLIGIYKLLEAMKNGKAEKAPVDLGTVDLSSFTEEKNPRA